MLKQNLLRSIFEHFLGDIQLTFNYYKFKSFENVLRIIFFFPPALSGASHFASEDQNLNNIYDDLLELSYSDVTSNDKKNLAIEDVNENRIA